MKALLALSAALVGVSLARTAGAQVTTNCGGTSEPAIGATCTATNTVSSVVSSVARLGLSVGTTSLTSPRGVDFGTAGNGTLVQSVGPTLSVAANVAYTVTATSGAATFTGSGGGSQSKPAADLQIKVGSGAFNALGGTVASSGSPTDLTQFTLTYGTLYNWTVDVPGTYTLGVIYTLTAP